MISRDLFRMRSYQLESRKARAAGCKRFVRLWHRRAGKDRDALSFMLEEMLKNVGLYFDIFPSLNQARRDVWNNIIKTPNGEMKMIDAAFPAEVVRRKDEGEMLVELTNGSIFQLMGADTDEAVERLRGPNPLGLNFSEFAHGTKMEKAWDTLRPVLQENGGWAMWSYTPNGPNHGETLWKMASKNPNWFSQKLTVEDTHRDAFGEDGSPVVTQQAIQDERDEGVREEFIQQEYYVSFTGYIHGTIYGDIIGNLEKEGRIGKFPWIVNKPVGVILDVGHSDTMSLWFYQIENTAKIFIDYWEATQKDIKDVVRMLREEKQYMYGRIVLPWDARGQMNYLEEVKFRNVNIVEKRTSDLTGSIDEVRRAFSQFYFDKLACERVQSTGISGMDCLKNYKRMYDDTARTFLKQPKHDQYSHGADALRTGVEGEFEPLFFNTPQDDRPIKVEMDFDPRDMFGERHDVSRIAI